MRTTVLGFAGLVASASAFTPTSFMPGMNKVAATRKSTVTGPVMGVKSGINGFGRIGRQVVRILMQRPNFVVKHINSTQPSECAAALRPPHHTGRPRAT